MKKYFKILFITFALFFVANNVFAQPLLELNGPDDPFVMADKVAVTSIMNPASTIGGVMAVVIKAFLSILGILFLVLVILGGFYWMTAGGDEQKMTKAKDILKKAIIGLIIIVSSYAITAFVFKALDDAGGDSNVGSPPAF